MRKTFLAARLFVLLLAPGCLGPAPGAPEAGSAVPEARTYECSDREGGTLAFVARTRADTLFVWLPAGLAAKRRALARSAAPAGGGARYEGAAYYEGSGVAVWTKGDEARLTAGARTYAGCTAAPQRTFLKDARRRGVDRYAVGQEPGWTLEISEGERIRFSYGYGEREAVAPAPAPAVDAAGRSVYRAPTAQGMLTATIAAEPCRDAMSGRPYATTVHVELGGVAYRGCGRRL